MCTRSQSVGNVPTKVFVAIGIISSGGGVLFGYDMGIISGASRQLQLEFDLSCTDQELVVSLLLLGALIGSLMGGHVIDYFGRKFSIMVSSVLFVVGAFVLALSQNYGTLLFGRITVGFTMALSAASECVYVSEVSPAAVRGRLVSLNEFGITIGILLSYFVGLAFGESPNGWRFMFGLSSIGGAVVFLTILFLPESPRHLLMKRKLVDAKKALKRLRTPQCDSPNVVDSEFADMEKRTVYEESSICQLSKACNSKLIFPIVIGAGLIVSQQTTGEPNILFYASTILVEMGFESGSAAGVASVALGISKVIATVVCLLSVDRWGRKRLLLIGCICITASVFGVSLLTHINGIQGRNLCILPNISSNASSNVSLLEFEIHQSVPQTRWISLVLLMAVVAAYSFSFGPVTWIMLSEIFPTHLRGRLFALVTSLNWAVNLIISATFLEFAKSGTGLALPFGLNTLFGFLAALFIYFVVPETKGRSLEQVQEMLDKGVQRYVQSKCCCLGKEEPLTPLIPMESC